MAMYLSRLGAGPTYIEGRGGGAGERLREMVSGVNWSQARTFTLIEESTVYSLINQMEMPAWKRALQT